MFVKEEICKYEKIFIWNFPQNLEQNWFHVKYETWVGENSCLPWIGWSLQYRRTHFPSIRGTQIDSFTYFFIFQTFENCWFLTVFQTHYAGSGAYSSSKLFTAKLMLPVGWLNPETPLGLINSVSQTLFRHVLKVLFLFWLATATQQLAGRPPCGSGKSGVFSLIVNLVKVAFLLLPRMHRQAQRIHYYRQIPHEKIDILRYVSLLNLR